MKTKVSGILICMLLLSVLIFQNAEPKNLVKYSEDYISDYIQGEIIVKFKPGIKFDFIDQNSYIYTGIYSIDKLFIKYSVFEIKGTYTSVIKEPKNPDLFSQIGLDRIYTIKISSDKDIYKALDDFKKNPNIEKADFSGIGFGCIIPNDPHFSKQWGFHNTGQAGGKIDADIDAPEAWDIQMGNLNIVVAIIDSGIDYNHQDLRTRIWINDGEDINGNGVVEPSDFNGIDDDGNGFIDDIRGWDFVNNDNDPMDDHTISHGTHCAGIAGANTFNNVGVAGTLWACEIMAIKAMKSNNQIAWKDAGPALVYAADMGADVISMSWSGSSDNTTLKDACDYAYASGCVLVAAMGNHGTSSPYIPAKYTTTIAVGATDRNDTRWSSSAYGSHINVVAPGVDIYSTIRNNLYGYLSGTSMATPMVAGLAGLLIAQDPTRTNVQIKSIICMTSEDEIGNPSQDKPGFDDYYGNGRINAYNALYNAPTKPSKPSGPMTGKSGIEYTYTTTSFDPDNDQIYYWWDWGDGTNSGWLGPYNSGQQTSARNSWNTQSSYSIRVKSKDVENKESEWSDPLEIVIPRNTNQQNKLLIKIINLFPMLFSIFKNIR
jgi:thermitase